MRTRLNLDDAKFANMHGFTLCSPNIRHHETLICLGIAIYAAYSATNNIRKKPHLRDMDMEETFLMLVEFAEKAVKGDGGAINCYNSRWVSDRQDREIAWDKDIWDEHIWKRKRSPVCI